jgi:hypothetical protein
MIGYMFQDSTGTFSRSDRRTVGNAFRDIPVSGRDAELARTRAERRLTWTLRNMTANLFRIVRGVGKAYEVVLSS